MTGKRCIRDRVDMNARYEAFGKAEAVLIDRALVVPFSISVSQYICNKLDVFEGQYAPFGVSGLRYKGQHLLDHYVSMEEYDANKAKNEQSVKMGRCCPENIFRMASVYRNGYRKNVVEKVKPGVLLFREHFSSTIKEREKEMVKYLGKRIARSFLTVIIILTIVFCLLRLMPSEGYFPNFDKMTPQQIQVGLQEMGLTDPLPVQIVHFFQNLIHGDLGVSRIYRANVPVTEILAAKVPVSIKLGIISMIVALLAGLPMGALMARYKYLSLIHI